jgi:hypothetical protein
MQNMVVRRMAGQIAYWAMVFGLDFAYTFILQNGRG